MSKKITLDANWIKLNTTGADVLITGVGGGKFLELVIDSAAAPGADAVGHTITQAIVLPKGAPAYIRNAYGAEVMASSFDGSDPTA